jgi:hypothetical protein
MKPIIKAFHALIMLDHMSAPCHRLRDGLEKMIPAIAP